jgi:hypothetical protein
VGAAGAVAAGRSATGRQVAGRTIISGILFRERTGVAPQVRTVLRLLGAPDPLPEE